MATHAAGACGISAGRAFAADGGCSSRSAPFVVYPVFLMKALCFALFACAFNLLIGYAGLLSFGHATFLGIGRLRHGARRQGRGAGRRSSAILARHRGARRRSGS